MDRERERYPPAARVGRWAGSRWEDLRIPAPELWEQPPSSTTQGLLAVLHCQGTCTEGSCVMKSEGGIIFLKILFLICNLMLIGRERRRKCAALIGHGNVYLRLGFSGLLNF